MRILFAILLVAEACLIAAPFISSGLDRPETARAWHEWQQNSTPEAEQAWETERTRLSRMKLVEDAVLFSLFVANSVGVFVVGRKVCRKSRSSPK